jgi:hypothetical protein
MTLLLISIVLVAGLAPAPGMDTAEATQQYYAEGNIEALQRLLRTSDDRMIQLLCRYRLYPLTQDERYLDDLPTSLDDPTARELALLAGLWGYRVSEAPVWKTPTYGRRSSKLLEDARTQDPDDPFVLLIEGQSYLFRPALFGGDVNEALRHFRKLQRVLAEQETEGISPLEAMLWEWYALEKMDTEAADHLKDRLLAQNPPVMYRQFLMDPP